MKNERDYGAELKEYEAKVVGEKELFDLFKPIEGKRQKKILAVNGIGKGNNADIGEINCVLEKLIAEEFSVDLFNAQDIANLLTISGKNIESGKTLDFQKVLKNNYSYAIYFGGCDCCFPSAFEGKGTDYCGELAELFGRDKTVLAISGNGGPAEYCALTVGNVPRDSRPNFVYHIKRD